MTTSCFLFSILILFSNGIFMFAFGDSNNTDVIEDNAIDALRKALLMNIEKYEVPKIDEDSYTDIEISTKIVHVEIEEDKGAMNIHGFLKMKWNNKFFKWDPVNYNGISNMHLLPQEIWIPQLALINSASVDVIPGSAGVLIFSNGTVVWNPPFQFQVFCSLNLKSWPYDTQNCDLRIGTSILKNFGIKLLNKGGIKESAEHMSSKWEILELNTSSESDTFFDYFTIRVTAKRDSSLYNPVFLTPAYCIILLSLSCFWLPPDSGEKIILTGFNVFVTTAFLMYFAQLLPVLGRNVPLVVMFYSVAMLMITISIIVSIFVIRLAHKEQGKFASKYLKKGNFTGVFKIMLCLGHINAPKRLKDDSHNEVIIDVDDSATPDKEDDEYQDRFLVASSIDRFFFGIYLFVYFILVLVYSI